MSSLLRTASWVIREKDGGKVLFETFDAKVAGAINVARYEAVPILEYLQSLNGARSPAMGENPGMDTNPPHPYDAAQAECERAFQAAEAGPCQLRGPSGDLRRSAGSLDEIEPHWEPGFAAWVR